MAKFFRKFRLTYIYQSKLGKYFIYAIGEIILVVIGILIAIQVDNWNNTRKQYELLRSYSKALINDLENDLEIIEISRRQVITRMMFIDSLRSYTYKRPMEDMNNLDLHILATAGYRAYAWNRSTMSELNSSGALRYMRNDSLAKKIAAYEAFTYHLDQDLQSDESQNIGATEAKNYVVNQNFGAGADSLHFRPNFWKGDTTEFPDYAKTRDYINVSKENLSLITSDINDVHVMVNRYIRIRGEYASRKIEMERAKRMASDLIALLREEYADNN